MTDEKKTSDSSSSYSLISKDTSEQSKKENQAKKIEAKETKEIVKSTKTNIYDNPKLEEFDNLVKEYLITLKKAHKGDHQATLTATRQQPEIYKLQDEIQLEKAQLKPEARLKFEQIQARLIKVASEL